MRTIENIRIYFLFLIVIVGVIALNAKAQSSLSSGEGAWEYYRSITITETSGENLTDYQVLVEIPGFNFPINAQKSGADIRFRDNDENDLSYWIEKWNYSENARIWVKIPMLPANASIKINMVYGNPGAVSMSNPMETFIKNSIYLMTGECVDEKNCRYMDDHEESNFIRYYTADKGTRYLSRINWGYALSSSIPGTNQSEKFYSRFRFLFFPDTSGEWKFAVDSDEGSELIKNPGDPSHPIDEKVLAAWYGKHEMCNCQSYLGNETLEKGAGVWMDYIMEEWTGNESAVVWIKKPGTDYWRILDSDNFPNQIFARKYASSEPYIEYVPREGGNPPHLKVSPEFPELAWGILYPGDSYSIQLDIRNTGSGDLEWYISKDQPWITVNPASGRNSATVTLDAKTANLDPGSYLGNIIIYSNGGNATIRMSGNISAAPINPITPNQTTIAPTEPETKGPMISDTVIAALIGFLATVITAYLAYRSTIKK